METQAGGEQPRCMFWKLPPELRDIIYDLVYGEARQLRVQMRFMWKYEQNIQKRYNRATHKATSFPDCVVSHLLVSKQYFDEAAHAYFRKKTLRIQCWSELARFADGKSPVQRELASLVTRLDMSNSSSSAPYYVQKLDNLPNLSGLIIRIDESTITPTEDKVPWLDDMADAELIQCQPLAGFIQLRGFPDVEIRAGTSCKSYVTNAQEAARLTRHLDKAEDFIRQAATKPRPAPQQSLHPVGIAKALELVAHSTPLRRGCALEQESHAERGASLEDDDVLRSADAFVRLFLSRPQGVFAWAKDLKERASQIPL
ncbi:hypothetical protein LTR85_000901 [Meristemomyces frigidus]|nr:hypothetical protein LTR85_000901 [Meristemomyces frigidus]